MAPKPENYKPLLPIVDELSKLCAIAEDMGATLSPALGDPPCTAIYVVWLQDANCDPIKHTHRCFDDGTETDEFIMPDGSIITDTGDPAVSNATPYTPTASVDQSAKTEVRNFYIVSPAAGTVADFVAAVIAAEAPAIQLPGEAAPVAVTADDVCGWSIDVLPCNAELEAGDIVPDGADFAFIGGLKATGDADAPAAGADITTTFTPAPVAGSIIGFCVSFERSQTVKA